MYHIDTILLIINAIIITIYYYILTILFFNICCILEYITFYIKPIYFNLYNLQIKI